MTSRPSERKDADGIVAFLGAFVPDGAHRIVLCFDVHFVDLHQGIDEVETAGEHIVLYFSVQRLDADFAGVDLDEGGGGKTGKGHQQSEDLNGSAITSNAIGSAGDNKPGDQQQNA